MFLAGLARGLLWIFIKRVSFGAINVIFKFFQKLSFHKLFLFRRLSDAEGTPVCEIIHNKSESEGRPERTFQLCCRSDFFSSS